jgi:hypothetical protein
MDRLANATYKKEASMQIFQGKIESPNSESGEEITILFPDLAKINDPVTIIRKSRPIHPSLPAPLANQKGIIKKIETLDPLTTMEFHVDGDYIFKAEIDHRQHRLMLEISNSRSPAGGFARVSLDVVAGVDIGFSATSTIFNDTNSIYHCTLFDSGSAVDAKTRVFYALGLIAAVAGVATLGASNVVGGTVAGAGLVLAAAGVLDAELPNAANPLQSMLIPGRGLSRTSYKAPLPDNSVSIISVDLNDGRHLVVKTATYENLGENLRLMSEIIGKLDPQSWSTLMELDLGSDKARSMEPYSIVAIDGILITNDQVGMAYNPMQTYTGYPGGTMTSFTKNAQQNRYDNPRRYNPWGSGKKPELKALKSGTVIFISTNSSTLTSSGSNIKILGSDYNTKMWVPGGYRVSSASNSGVRISGVTTIAAFEKAILDNPNYSIYSWHNGSDYAIGYTADSDARIIDSSDTRDNVYIKITDEKAFYRIK